MEHLDADEKVVVVVDEPVEVPRLVVDTGLLVHTAVVTHLGNT